MSFQFAVKKINTLHEKYVRNGGLQKSNYVYNPKTNFVTRGIRNRSNTCFIAATLQCLNVFSEPIRHMIEQSFELIYLYGEEDYILLDSYVQMLNKGFNSINISNEFFEGLFSKFIDALFESSNVGGLFTRGEQADAHEFTVSFMNQIDEYLVEIELGVRGIKESEHESFDTIYQSYMDSHSVYKNCFGFELLRTMKCQKNGFHGKSNKITSNCFSLEIDDSSTSIESCFDKYFDNEIIEQVHCLGCREKQDFSSQLDLYENPKNCFIMLKRFKVIFT